MFCGRSQHVIVTLCVSRVGDSGGWGLGERGRLKLVLLVPKRIETLYVAWYVIPNVRMTGNLSCHSLMMRRRKQQIREKKKHVIDGSFSDIACTN